MKKYELFGITINDYPLKESLNVTRSFLHEPGVNTISYASKDILMSVADYPYQKEWLHDLDLILFAEPIEVNNRKHLTTVNRDGKNDDYLDTILKNIVAAKETIFLVADNRESLAELKRTLKKNNSRLKFVGECVYTRDNMEAMFNEINCISPSIVFSCMPWNIQGKLMVDAKRMLGIRVWLGFLPEFIEEKQTGIKAFVQNAVNQMRFSIKLNNYNKQSL